MHDAGGYSWSKTRVGSGIACIALLGLLASSCRSRGESEVRPPKGFEWIRIGMDLDELREKVSGLVKPRKSLPLYEQRQGLPEPFSLATYLFEKDRLVRVVMSVEPSKSSAGLFEKFKSDLAGRFGKGMEKADGNDRGPAKTWCGKNACLSVRLLAVPMKGISHDYVYLVYESLEKFKNRKGGVKVFDLTGKVGLPLKGYRKVGPNMYIPDQPRHEGNVQEHGPGEPGRKVQSRPGGTSN